MSDSTPDLRPRWRFKPPMGRQRFLELAVVVFGVLIGLGLDNMIQEFRFRADARDLERAFVGDLENAAFLSLERQAITPCLVRRLRTFSDRVSTATGVLQPAEAVITGSVIRYANPQIYRAPARIWVASSFDRALGSEAFKRIPADRAAIYANIFATIAGQQELNDAEFLAIAGIAPLAFTQTDMNAEVRADALQQIATLDRYQALLTVSSQDILNGIFSRPAIGNEVRRLFVQKAKIEAFRSEIKANYGDCADLTVIDRLPRAAGS